MIIACNQTQDNTQPLTDNSEASPEGLPVLSDNTGVASGETGSQHSEDVDVSTDDAHALSGSVDVSVDGRYAPPGDPQVDFDYIEWVLENPAAQFVGLWSPDPVPSPYESTTEGMAGFLWIEYPCVYLRDPEPIPLDIQSVADLDLDLEKAASEIASWPPAFTGYHLSSRWVPADVQVVYESDPAHRILLRLPRKSSISYDLATGELWMSRWRNPWVPVFSGDFILVGTHVDGLSSEYRSLGCDARAQLKIGGDASRKSVSDWYGHWR